MAQRPVFLPNKFGPRLVEERVFSISWAPGFSISQKRKNIFSLHEEAKRNGIKRVLEISTKSDSKLGQRLSSFSLKIDLDGATFPLESVYQGSKVFENCGPTPAMYVWPPREAKRHIGKLDCGRLVGFQLAHKSYPITPKNAFYDWLYIRSIEKHSKWIEENVVYDAFTDIEFNPAKQVNCQARALAEYLSLMRRGKLREAASSFQFFSSMLNSMQEGDVLC